MKPHFEIGNMHEFDFTGLRLSYLSDNLYIQRKLQSDSGILSWTEVREMRNRYNTYR